MNASYACKLGLPLQWVHRFDLILFIALPIWATKTGALVLILYDKFKQTIVKISHFEA